MTGRQKTEKVNYKRQKGRKIVSQKNRKTVRQKNRKTKDRKRE